MTADPGLPAFLRRTAIIGVAFAAAVLAICGRAVLAAEGTAAMLDIDGPIGPAVVDHVAEGIALAGERNMRLVILRLDTPGGLDASMRRINGSILTSPVPVVCWVAPDGARAASAGTYILYACHLAAMAPGTSLGAATPVAMGGEMDDAMRAKAVNDAAAYLRGLAQLRGRNAEWAEKAVREGASLTATEAAEQKVIDLVARDLDSLLDAAHGRSVTVSGTEVTLAARGLRVERIEPGFRNRALAVLTTPEVAYILLLVGVYGILFELMNPGAIFPGVVGGVALLLGLYALNLLPVNYAGVGLILLGMALMLAEAFAPSFGILGLGGAVAFALGSLMMFGTDVPGFELPLALVIGATVVIALLVGVGLAAAIRSRRGRPTTGGEALVGATGRVEQWEGDEGAVHLKGETWRAHAVRPLVAGEQVRVVERDGLILTVEPIEDHQQGRP